MKFISVDQASAIALASECVHTMTCSLGHMIWDSRAAGCCKALHYIALVYSAFKLEIELTSGKFSRCRVDNYHPWVEHFAQNNFILDDSWCKVEARVTI